MKRLFVRPKREAADEGTALIFALVFIIIGSLMLVPMMNYVSVVLRGDRVQQHKASRAEAVRGALRVTLADPSALYVACSASGLHTAVTLAAPDLGVPVSTECTTLSDAAELADADLRVALGVVEAGAVPPIGTIGAPYAGSGNADVGAWWADVSAGSEGGKIFLPPLPSHGVNHLASAGYMMPAWAGSCRVFFPGTYTDAVTIADSVPTFFTSGVYYFENTVTFGANANVVVGEGAIEGCTTNSEAAFYAVNAPSLINISGIGGTFVFGAAGRMVVTDSGTANGPRVRFNARLVDPTDVGNYVSAGVSIETVNGVTSGATSSTDLVLPGQLQVPKSTTETNPGDTTPPVDAASTGYRPSTLVPTVSPVPPVAPVIDFQLTGTSTTTVYIPGYVSVPQGAINVTVGSGKGANKSIQLVGGVLAAKITQSVDLPADNQLGMVNRIVQKTFKIVSTTTSGTPHITSIAIVQVNDYGKFAVNSWVTSAG
ncbi:MAG: hypothetical protein K8R99_06115 [Actinomycetia bacterium]|nr:hypothetical protein [Actinomycetes bacterium]